MKNTIFVSEVVSALSCALDLTEGQPMGHAIRSCMLGIRIGEQLGLNQEQLSDLYYAQLLKDSGCSTNSARMHQILSSDDLQAKREVKFQDWTRVSLSGLGYALRNVAPNASPWQRLKKMVEVGRAQKRNNHELISARCERGAEIARKIGLSEAASEAIQALDEHWDGGGYPQGLVGQQIPILARIMNVSQTLEVFAAAQDPSSACRVLKQRSGKWFDPEVVRAARTLLRDQELWHNLQNADARESLLALEAAGCVPASSERIDSICQAFAEVVDAKSPFTFRHSVGVSLVAVELAKDLGLDSATVTMIHRAALLHDIGKLGVSNAILDKPGKLTPEEWQAMKLHPAYTRQILEIISGFEQMARVAGAHHERLDGSGYPDGMTKEELTLPARIIAVADVYQALSETRAYREGLAPEVVLKMMAPDVSKKLDAKCFDALRSRHETKGTKSLAQTAGR